jgi:hypothetical protein
MFFDPLYLLIFIVTMVISLGAQMYIKSAYGKWSKVANSHNLTGLQVGQEQLLRSTDLGTTYQTVQGKRRAVSGRRRQPDRPLRPPHPHGGAVAGGGHAAVGGLHGYRGA